ncbi:MAG TPA: hypothetical protein PLU67_05120 [Candidatus Kapabacteria bacterium]|nr:hypothetical protein [Candidatus Kapabacteria bacterium]HPU24036.1 hypothetical protein [Candidatus Kapabacteria bacterium]
MRMKYYLIIFFFTITLSLIASDVFISSFTANSTSNSIVLEWRTTDETGLNKFEIERSIKGSPFQKVSEEKAKGVPSFYRYIDNETLLKISNEIDKNDPSTLNKNYYIYRIKSVFNNGNAVYSDEVKVNHTVNSIRRTWGMIKEMFK